MTELPPLRDRVPRDGRAVAPLAVPGVAWRAMSAGDLSGVHEMLARAARADHPEYTIPIDEIRALFDASWVDVEADGLVGERDGAMVAAGLAELSPARSPRVSATLHGAVLPSARGGGVGRSLLQWQRGRALEQFAQVDAAVPGWLCGWNAADNARALRLFAGLGSPAVRRFTEMRLVGDPVQRPIPAGYRVVDESDVPADDLRRVKNEVFAEHWGSAPRTEEEWHAVRTSPQARPDLGSVALDEHGAIAGFVLAEVNADDWPGTGFSFAYLPLVGVAAAHRARGLAAGLLSATVTAARATGLDGAVLSVDSENASGAGRLYASLGFVQGPQTVVSVEVV